MISISNRRTRTHDTSSNELIRTALMAFVVLCTAAGWAPATELMPDVVLDPSVLRSSERFGQAAALSPAFAVAGAQSDIELGGDAGAVFLYRLDTLEETKLVASDGGPDALFGFSVAISGPTLAVGAPGDRGDLGSVYLFERRMVIGTGLTWLEVRKLNGPGSVPHNFGWSVALDGDYLAVGSYGTVYVYERNLGSAGSWSMRLPISSPLGKEPCLYAVAISSDYLVIGARYQELLPQKQDSGLAYVFRRTDEGWAYQEVLVPNDPSADALFGWSVAIHGTTVAVGAPFHDAAGAGSGAAYVFADNGVSFSQVARLVNSDSDGVDQYLGWSVALDDHLLLAGAPNRDWTGGAYLYDHVSNRTLALLTEAEPETNAVLGNAVALAGEYMMATAPWHDIGTTVVDSGQAMIYSVPVFISDFEAGDLADWSVRTP